MVEQMDLSSVCASYDGSKGGYPAYHPEMMVAHLIYAYCVGVPSSRKIEKARVQNRGEISWQNRRSLPTLTCFLADRWVDKKRVFTFLDGDTEDLHQ
jgi:transposase